MTDLTPQQMRGIAGEMAGNPTPHSLHEGIAALRVAADQLEAVRAFTNELRGAYSMEFVHGRLSAILTADTATQEGRDE